jgi:maltooligosyltrehalose trehalohydrolase
MYKQVMQIRKQDPVFSRQGQDGLDGAVIGTDAFLLRFFGQKEDDRLMLVNLGRDIHLQIEAEPLLAPPGGRKWEKMWSSEDAEYGGGGTGSIICDDGWHIPADSTIVLRPEQTGEDNEHT